MTKKLAKLFWGLVLVPWMAATFCHVPALLPALGSNLNGVLWLLGGAALYAGFELLFSRPMRTYVFGHELTHALASLAIGGKVHSFNVSKSGGSVTISKTNFFVALAPYCVPIYTLLLLGAFYLARFWWPVERYRQELLFLIGFTLAFHGSLTLFAVRQKQPDIHKTGIFFSFIFILLVNAWILVALVKVLFWNLFSIRAFFMGTLKTQLAIWTWLAHKTVVGARWVYQRYGAYRAA